MPDYMISIGPFRENSHNSSHGEAPFASVSMQAVGHAQTLYFPG